MIRRACLILAAIAATARAEEHRYVYVATPGIRDYLEYGGHGVLVFDVDAGHKFARRINSGGVDEAGKPRNVKGIVASAVNKRLYVATTHTLTCINLLDDAILWERAYEGGCDRMSITPDGRQMYLPSLEKGHWHVVDPLTGDVLARITARLRLAQHRRRPRRQGGLPRRPPLAAADGRRHLDARRLAHGRPLRRGDPALHRRRQAGSLLCQRERAARLRGRRPRHRREARPGQGPGLRDRPGQAPRLPVARDRPDARRAGAVGLRLGQQAPARLRRHGAAPAARREPGRPRRARLGHVLARRPVCVPIHG